MRKQTKSRNQLIREAIEKFCMDKYGYVAKWKKIKIRYCTKYYLTECGDRFKIVGTPPRVSLIKGDKMKGRKSKTGKRWKSGFVVDHFYRKIDGEKSKVFFSITRAKLMYMVFKNWPLTKVRAFKFFPKDGNNNNPHIENLIPVEKFMDGFIKVYGKPQSGKLTNRQVVSIRKSNKTNKELAVKYKRNFHTISRIRNNRSYKDVHQLV